MLRILLVALLTCASFTPTMQAAGLFDLFNPVRNLIGAIGDAVEVKPEAWTPEFQPRVYVIPPYKLDQTPNDGTFRTPLKLREFVTYETAVWIAKNIPGYQGTVQSRPYIGNGYATDRPVEYWFVVFGGTEMNAGQLAWYFTRQNLDAKEGDPDAGFWPYFTDDKTRMNGGKAMAELAVRNSIQQKTAHGPTLPPDPWVPI
jgi:hypothetical protein